MIIHGNSLHELTKLDDCSVDALVTDPPYGLSSTKTAQVTECLLSWTQGQQWTPKGKGFMNKEWDNFVPSPELWRETFRVMKHGAHGVIFAGTRTQDLMSISLRLAGFEIRDTLMWIYGSGFPKSHNVALGIDKLHGHSNRGQAIPTASRYQASDTEEKNKLTSHPVPEYESRSAESRDWVGWGTALKPAYEPIILVRKPIQGTVARNVLAHGVGGLNIDATRVPLQEGENTSVTPQANNVTEAQRGFRNKSAKIGSMNEDWKKGRWPANILLDKESSKMMGAPSRYFYTSKASKAEREAGLEKFRAQVVGMSTGAQTKIAEGAAEYQPPEGLGYNKLRERANVHPTVKPLDLMRYLCRLITPPEGTILDPFCGSGTTLCAAALENFASIGIERESEYVAIAQARFDHWSKGLWTTY